MREYFTDKLVADLDLEPGKGADQWAFDRQQTGLAMRMRGGADGTSKFWYHSYRFGGKKRHDKLGRLCDLTVNDARALVYRRQRDVVEGGVDPHAQRDETQSKAKVAANTPTFFIAVGQFLEDYRRDVRPSTLRNTTGWLLGPLSGGPAYCEPLKSKRVDLITSRDIADLVTSLKNTRSRQVAQSVRAALQSFFRWAMERKYVVGEVSPVKGVTCPAAPKKSKRKKRPLSTDEIVKVWNALGDDAYGKLTKLTILIGVRRQEIGAMRWSELDLDAGVWTIPGERTKTHETYVTPLAAAVVDILRSIERQDGREYVFGSRSSNGFSSFSEGKRKLDAAAAIEPWRFHDLRSTIVTVMGTKLGIPPHVRAAVLNNEPERKVTREQYEETDY